MVGMMKHALSKSAAIKVSVCVPCRDQLHSAFAFDLAKLVQHCAGIGLDVVPHFSLGTLIVNQRDQLAEMALDAGSTHILWLDSDMIFPADTIQQLLAHDKSVVAGNYVTRQYPHKTVAYEKLHDWSSYVVNDAELGTDLIEVEAVGMGCMLVTTDLVRNMRKPRFQVVWQERYQDHMGEDFFFCLNARELGHEIWIDNSLSRQLSHLGTFAFTHNLVKSDLL